MSKRPIPVDGLTHRQLNRNGMTLNTVPAMGEVVTVRNVAGLSVGADPLQAFEESPAEIKTAAANAVAAIPGLGWGGVDMIIQKGTGTPYVVEINSEAAYGAALFPAYGEPRDVGTEVWRLRYDATEPDPSGAPELPTAYPRGQVLSLATGMKGDDCIAFDHLLEESLARRQYTVETKSSGVLHVTSPDGEHTWITIDGRTARDRSVVRHVIQRHQWVSKLLNVREIPQPRSRIVTSTRQLRSFTEGRIKQVSIAPANARWDGPDSRKLTEQEVLDLESLSGRTWVQARPAGRRVRILATPEKVWAITSETDSRPLADDLTAAAGEMAVEAVRAIPELRWAAVDTLIRQSRIRDGRPNGVLVEGLTDQPTYSTHTRLLAGDFDIFFHHLIKSTHQ